MTTFSLCQVLWGSWTRWAAAAYWVRGQKARFVWLQALFCLIYNILYIAKQWVFMLVSWGDLFFSTCNTFYMLCVFKGPVGSLWYETVFQNYLRLWALKLEMPILSVDYSLAPEQPFPRALEETFYAYSWALKNPEKLGKNDIFIFLLKMIGSVWTQIKKRL